MNKVFTNIGALRKIFSLAQQENDFLVADKPGSFSRMSIEDVKSLLVPSATAESIGHILTVNPNMDNVEGVSYKTYAEAKAFAITQTLSPSNLWGIRIYGTNYEDIALVDHLWIHGEKGSTVLMGEVSIGSGGLGCRIYDCVVDNLGQVAGSSCQNAMSLWNCDVRGGKPTGDGILLYGGTVSGGDFSNWGTMAIFNGVSIYGGLFSPNCLFLDCLHGGGVYNGGTFYNSKGYLMSFVWEHASPMFNGGFMYYIFNQSPPADSRLGIGAINVVFLLSIIVNRGTILSTNNCTMPYPTMRGGLWIKDGVHLGASTALSLAGDTVEEDSSVSREGTPISGVALFNASVDGTLSLRYVAGSVTRGVDSISGVTLSHPQGQPGSYHITYMTGKPSPSLTLITGVSLDKSKINANNNYGNVGYPDGNIPVYIRYKKNSHSLSLGYGISIPLPYILYGEDVPINRDGDYVVTCNIGAITFSATASVIESELPDEDIIEEQTYLCPKMLFFNQDSVIKTLTEDCSFVLRYATQVNISQMSVAVVFSELPDEDTSEVGDCVNDYFIWNEEITPAASSCDDGNYLLDFANVFAFVNPNLLPVEDAIEEDIVCVSSKKCLDLFPFSDSPDKLRLKNNGVIEASAGYTEKIANDEDLVTKKYVAATASLSLRKTIININGKIEANTNFSVTSNGTNYITTGDDGNLLESTEEFNASKRVSIYLNGTLLDNGTSAIWVSVYSFALNVIVDNDDEIIILS